MIANHHMSNDTIGYNKTQYVYIRCNGTCQSPYEQRWPTINDRVIAKSARVPNDTHGRVPNDAHHGINIGNRRRQRNKCALACATPAQGTFKHTNTQKHNCKYKYRIRIHFPHEEKMRLEMVMMMKMVMVPQHIPTMTKSHYGRNVSEIKNWTWWDFVTGIFPPLI